MSRRDRTAARDGNGRGTATRAAADPARPGRRPLTLSDTQDHR